MQPAGQTSASWKGKGNILPACQAARAQPWKCACEIWACRGQAAGGLPSSVSRDCMCCHPEAGAAEAGVAGMGNNGAGVDRPAFSLASADNACSSFTAPSLDRADCAYRRKLGIMFKIQPWIDMRRCVRTAIGLSEARADSTTIARCMASPCMQA